MRKLKNSNNQKSILDFFKKTDNSNTSDSIIERCPEYHSNLFPRKRKRAISKKVKKVLKTNVNKKIETISISDESNNDSNDASFNEPLFQLEEDSITIKNEDIDEILSDWKTPPKSCKSEELKKDEKEYINDNIDISNFCNVLINDKYTEYPFNQFDRTSKADIKIENVPTNDSNRNSEIISSSVHQFHITSNTGMKIENDVKFNEKTPTKDYNDTSSEYSSGSYCSNSLKISRIVSPERTPTPSPGNSNHINSTLKKSPRKLNRDSSSSGSTSQVNRLVKNVSMCENSTNYGSPVKRKLSLESIIMVDENISPGKISTPTKYWKIEGLYLNNFNFILTHVLSFIHNKILFNDDDNKFIMNFHMLSLEAKKLYVRLFQRNVRWLQYEKIFYPDICDKEDTYLYLNELIYCEFLQSESNLEEISDILQVLGKKQLQQLCKDFKIKSNGRRENIISNLIKNSHQQRNILTSFGNKSEGSCLLKRSKCLVGKCFILNKIVKNVFFRILTLFSLPSPSDDENYGQQTQLTVLLMQKLGKLKFPSVEVLQSTIIFSNRDSLISFSKCYQLECDIKDLVKQKEWSKVIEVCNEAKIILTDLLEDFSVTQHDASLPNFLRRFTSISVLLFIQNHFIEALQKLKKYKEAVQSLEFLLKQKVYLQDCRGGWYDRLALNYEQHLKNPEKALEIIIEADKDPEVVVGHRLALSQRAERILKSNNAKKFEAKYKDKFSPIPVKEAPKLVIQANSLPSDIPGFKRIYIYTTDVMNEETSIISSVEEFVLTHYRKKGYKNGLHAEGRSVHVIFGLLFWDCIYSPVPDTFLCPYQGVPLDLDSNHFYQARKDIIDERLSKLRGMCIEAVYEEVERIWIINEGNVSIVNWNIFNDIEHLKGLILCLGIELITAICERLCKNHRFTRSGFPDLIVWNVNEKTSRIVEVKGPNDKLSTKQMLWLEFLMNNGASTEVCHVEALGQRRNNP